TIQLAKCLLFINLNSVFSIHPFRQRLVLLISPQNPFLLFNRLLSTCFGFAANLAGVFMPLELSAIPMNYVDPLPPFEKAYSTKSPSNEKYTPQPVVLLREIPDEEPRIYILPRNLFFWGFLLPGPIWFYGFIAGIVVPYFNRRKVRAKTRACHTVALLTKEHEENVWGTRCLGAFTMTLLLIGFVLLVGYQSDWRMGFGSTVEHGAVSGE
ncbi:hypothetical protein NEOLI_000735, partial [Neolecta irregularis DAH-3]